MLTFQEAAKSPGVIEMDNRIANNRNELTDDGYPVYDILTFPGLLNLGMYVWMGEELFVPMASYKTDPDRQDAFEKWLDA